MTLANPLPLAGLMDLLPVETVRFVPQWHQEASRTGGGSRLYADRAPMTWMADITTAIMSHHKADALMARINSRGGGLKTVLIYDPRTPYPESDPNGTLFGAATPLPSQWTGRIVGGSGAQC